MAGSSPLTRGKQGGVIVYPDGYGLIPAHAGKTRDGVLKSMSIGAHPRSRGENIVEYATSPVLVGSSPLTRGKRDSGVFVVLARGLIPAHAGKTKEEPCTDLKEPAHPRSRGENHTGRWAGRGLQGSSPLTRGKQCRWRLCLEGGRLIPAHAGKTIRRPP